VDNLVIRTLKSEDWRAISQIYAAITQEAVKDDFKRIVQDRAQQEEVSSFVAELEGRVVGYMISHILPGGFGIKKSIWITMLGVNPSFMGRGIGERMAREVFNYSCAKQIRQIYTSVRWDSTDLLSFFKTLKFDRSNFINLIKTLE
jgi:ribosomal protein S18 acetylase RimI-like enzyme